MFRLDTFMGLESWVIAWISTRIMYLFCWSILVGGLNPSENKNSSQLANLSKFLGAEKW